VTYDAVVVGGSYAGLSAAMMLARARRSVLVIGAGSRRNRFASHAHGVLALDGVPGAEIVSAAAAQLARYPTVEQLAGTVTAIGGADGSFSLRLADGGEVVGHKVLLATGVSDALPAVPGIAEHWGRSVFHCPYCHGYEIGGGPIGVLATGGASAAQAATLADWGEITFFTGGTDCLSVAERTTLARRRVAVDTRPVLSLGGDVQGPVVLHLADGTSTTVQALFLLPSQAPSPLAEALGCALEDTPHGKLIATDERKLTSVRGIYAAGDTARLPSNVTLAAAPASTPSAAVHQALIADSLGHADTMASAGDAGLHVRQLPRARPNNNRSIGLAPLR
jgi:thioredoxin reductase